MNVASLELCKELYELSLWETEIFYWRDLHETDDEMKLAYPYERISSGSGGYQTCPAYDLGYLLRKLPQELITHHVLDLTHFPGHWAAAYLKGLDSTDIKYVKTADTPENAACKLAIELFKQGVLTKESQS